MYATPLATLCVCNNLTEMHQFLSHFFVSGTGSAIVYSYTEVRNIVKKYSKTLNPDFDEAVEFDQPELVVTQMATEQNPFDGTFLKYPVNAKGIHKFIELNQKYLVGDDDGLGFNPEGDGSADFDGDGIVDLPIMKRLIQFEAIDADIIEFDDEFVAEGLSSELVFCIILNRTEKRVTVVFRGSVSVKDWLVDLSALKTTPDEIKEFGGRRVDIHAGFSSELLCIYAIESLCLLYVSYFACIMSFRRIHVWQNQ